MAHNLNEEGKRMFYTGKEPWHGLGIKLDNPATSQEAIQAARLDYPLKLQDMYINIGIVGQKTVEGKQAVVRQDNNDILGVVGDRYRIIQNTEAFSFFDNVIGEGQAVYHTAGALGKGERIWILAKLPGDLMVTPEDKCEKYLLLVNSHDGTCTLKMFFTPVRVVCQNTLIASFKNASDGISIRHTINYQNKVNEAQRALGIAIKYYDKLEQGLQYLSSVDLTISEVETYFEKLLIVPGKEKSMRVDNQMHELVSLFEHGEGNQMKTVRGTAWAAYNAVTEYVDHYRGVKNIEKDQTNKLKSIWMGSGANLKQKAFSYILDLVATK